MPTPEREENGTAFQVGQSASLTRRLTQEDVARFAELTGDTNPIHLDAEYAAGTRFGGPIAHGLLTLSLVGTLLGTRLPGPGAIYVEQRVSFLRPVYPGDEVTARVEVAAFESGRGRLTLRTACFNGSGECVLDGEALLLVGGR